MHPLRHALAAEQQNAEEGSFQKKSRQRFVSHERSDDARRQFRVAAPIRAELERHDDARHDPHAEGHGEDPDPERRDAQIRLASGPQEEPFQHRDVGGEADREGRQQKMECDEKGELNAGEE
ncbi:hypothetical protein D3C83_18600 [compost metagenome]